MKAYKLTSDNRHLADFFQDIIIDEEKSILWSKQDLSLLNCQEVNLSLSEYSKLQNQSFFLTFVGRINKTVVWVISLSIILIAMALLATYNFLFNKQKTIRFPSWSWH